jgi:hypothetical protein
VDALKPIIQRIAILLLTLASVGVSQAQAVNRLELFKTVESRLDIGGSQAWTFSAPEGMVLSFRVEKTSGDIDPRFTIAGQNGQVLIGNDDYNYPKSRDALLEAITIPRTDSYTLTVSALGKTSGSYKITMLTGYATLKFQDNFSDKSKWKSSSDALSVNLQNNQATLTLEGTALSAVALRTGSDVPADYYAQVSIDLSGQSIWMAGMTARQSGDRSYVLLLNDRGQWRFTLRSSQGEQVLRDWTPHPAIKAGDTQFTLGILANGPSFDFFYDGQFFGRIADNTLTDAGQLGLAVQTPNAFNAKVVAAFSSLSVTAPVTLNGKGILPEQLLLGAGVATAQELQRRRLIPSGGQMALQVNQSFSEFVKPGVNRIMLGRGATYTNFAMGAAISWKAGLTGTVGCGLVLRSTSDTDYTLAYLDQTGGYGVSQREGDQFRPGIFGTLQNMSGASHNLLVVARDNQIYYYIDGFYRGTLSNSAVDGNIGGAVVNFDPVDTSCTFTDIWLWRWP